MWFVQYLCFARMYLQTVFDLLMRKLVLLEFGRLVYEFQTAGLWRNRRPWLSDPFGSTLKWFLSPVEECFGNMQIPEGEIDAFRSLLVHGEVACTCGLIC